MLWASDGGIGGTREYPAVRLTPTGLADYTGGDGVTVYPSGEYQPTLPGSDTSFKLIDQFYLSKWTTDIEFDSDDRDDIQWTAGDIEFASGVTFTIVSGSAVIPSAQSTYVYLDRATSETVLQTTNDFSDLVKIGIVLIARGVYSSIATQDALIIGESVIWPKINETVIGPNSIKTGHLQTNCVDTDQLNASAVEAGNINVSTLSAISANVGTLTAGLISNSAGTVQFNLTSGVITVNKTGGLVISGTNGMTVTGDINVTTGDINIGTGGDIIFNTCCTFDATSSYMYVRPDGTTTGKILSLGSSGARWGQFYCGANYFTINATNTISITGTAAVGVTGTADVTARSTTGNVILRVADGSGNDVHMYLSDLVEGTAKTNRRIYAGALGVVKWA